MKSLFFASYALAHLGLCIWAFRLWRERRAPGALILAIMSAGLVYDNTMIATGSLIGLGPLLKAMSWPRFILHALVTPFLFIATLQIARAAEFGWAQRKTAEYIVWAVVIAMIAYGVIWDVLPLELQPACFDGIVRYTSSASPAQFCFPDQVQAPGVGPPIPSIAADLFIIGVGIAIWRRWRWHWMATGGILMFFAAAAPTGRFGLVFGNGGEVILEATLVMTAARFSFGRK